MNATRTSKLLMVLGGSFCVALLTAGCSLGTTDSTDSTTTLPTVTTSKAASSQATDDAQPSSTTAAIQTAAERYGTETSTTLPPLLTNDDSITTAGLGPVRIGQLVEEAQSEAGVELIAASTGSEACRYYTPAAGATGASFMVVNGEVVRVDISSGPITTKSGYGIGSTKDAIKTAFGSKIQESADGDYVMYVPVSDGDKNMRVIWELDAEGTVTSLRTGRVPHVTPKIGCAGG
ncbi:MAG: hypothetical protein CL422_00420 [Acidimicrobiaceae bacterium]|nr:hypothetical protein [Acidimicrobiaceae bacterium]